MPFTPTYNPSILTSTDIGNFTQSHVSTNFGNSNVSNIMSITIPTAGVWFVEGQMNANITNVALYYYWSLSTASQTLDFSRFNYVWTGNVSVDLPGNHMSSVFVTPTDNYKIYMTAAYPSGQAYNNQTYYMTYTRLA
jgi:hypothetical protein